jgi:hypothetical protein
VVREENLDFFVSFEEAFDLALVWKEDDDEVEESPSCEDDPNCEKDISHHFRFHTAAPKGKRPISVCRFKILESGVNKKLAISTKQNKTKQNVERMKTTSVVLVVMSQAVFGKNLLPLEDYQSMFQEWMTEYSMTISEIDYDMRLQIFADTHDLIQTHNSDPMATYQLGHNQFSHLTIEEFAQEQLSAIPLPNKKKTTNKIHEVIGASPTTWDWSNTGAVTPVKDQGKCRFDD